MSNIKGKFEKAVESFVSKVKGDPNIIAVFLAGSLAYDTVWEKSDIDISVILRDQPILTKSYSLDEDGLTLNIALYNRSDFKKMIGKTKAGGGLHSYFTKGKFVYTTDNSLNEFIEDFKQMGADDIEMVFFNYATYLIGTMEKIEKWLTVKNDALYAQYYVLKAADMLADMKLILNGHTTSRESVLKVTELYPEFIEPFYQIPLSRNLTREEVAETLEKMEQFLTDNIELLKRPVLEYMSDGEVKTVTQLTKHFSMDSHGITHIFEFLVKMGVIDKVSETIRITPKGRKAFEETAFVYINF